LGYRVNRFFIIGVIATMPLFFGAVQTRVWAVYAGVMMCVFLVDWWQGNTDLEFLKSPLLIFSAGIFLVFTFLQVVPVPLEVMELLSPVRRLLLARAYELTGQSEGWQSLSYDWQASFAWWVFLAGLLLFARVVYRYVGRTRNLILLVKVMFGVALFEALYGLVQALIPTLGVLWADINAYMGNSRGTFINRNHFAGYVEMVWPLGLGLIAAMAHAWTGEGHGNAYGVKRFKNFLSSDRLGLQLFLWAALLFILLALLFSKSRAGITGAFIGLVAFIALAHAGEKRFSRPAWVMMGAGFAFLLFYGNVIGLEELIGRFMALEEGAGSRTDIWRDSLMIIKDHPLGIGLQSYEQVMPVYNSLGPPGIKFTHAHNDYLELLAEAGWPGFLALVGGFYVFLGRSIWKIKKYGKDIDAERFFIGIGACCGLISIAFHSLFDFNLQIPSNLLYFVVLVVILRSCLWNRG